MCLSFFKFYLFGDLDENIAFLPELAQLKSGAALFIEETAYSEPAATAAAALITAKSSGVKPSAGFTETTLWGAPSKAA